MSTSFFSQSVFEDEFSAKTQLMKTAKNPTLDCLCLTFPHAGL